jgi:dihydroxyacid dehydratase/phosphogluconate dehydratase
MTIPTTRGEFSQKLDKAMKELVSLKAKPLSGVENLRLTHKKEAVENALAMWIALTASANEEEFLPSIAEFRGRIGTLIEMTDFGTREGYKLVASYFDESDFYLE